MSLITLILPALISVVAVAAQAQNTTYPQQRIAEVVDVPARLQYNLPGNYSNDNYHAFVDTNTTEETTQQLLRKAQTAAIISFDAEFRGIVGQNPSIQLVDRRENRFAWEGAIWIPSRNQAWFTSATNYSENSFVSILSLDTLQLSQPELDPPLPNANGGRYFNNTIWFAALGLPGAPGGIFTVDPDTNMTSTVINTYNGLSFNGVDDLDWVRRGSKSYLYFTDIALHQLTPEFAGQPSSLSNAVYRYDPQDESVVPVISKADVIMPNGVKTNLEGTKLYVTDTLPVVYFGTGIGNNSGSAAIYEYDLDEEARPVNKRLFGLTRTGVSDGIYVDDAGRVWTAEGDGVVVRSKTGKTIGIFNGHYFQGVITTSIANFILAGDKLVILGGEDLWVVQLNQMVQSASRIEV